MIPLLTIISFLFFLAIAEWASGTVFRAGLIGQIIVGLIYGVPIGNILALDWQRTFVDLGYVGLILIVFEGMQEPEAPYPLLPKSPLFPRKIKEAPTDLVQAASRCGWICCGGTSC